MAEGPLIYLVAGEPSGDALGAPLMAALKQETTNARFIGVGGPLMAEEGLQSLFPMQELTVMGLLEVVPRIPALLRRIRQTADDIIAKNPDVVVTIDSPDFCFRVAKRVHAHSPQIKLVHYVAPTVWAWKKGRAKKVARFLTHMLCLFPFEPRYFTRHGLDATFVGHPAVAREKGDGPGFRKRHGISAEETVLAVLPGSREIEISRLLEPFGAALARLQENGRAFRVVVPTVSGVEEKVRAAVKRWPGDPVVTLGTDEKTDAFAAADVALAASGTVTLELAVAGVPTVVAYRVLPLSAWLGRLLITYKWVSLPNILMDKQVYPELLQEDCTPQKLSTALEDLLLNRAGARQQQAEDLIDLSKSLSAPGDDAAGAAADAVLRAVHLKEETAPMGGAVSQ